MTDRARLAAAIGRVFCIFLFVQLGAIALATPFEAAGHQPVDDPQDPTNTVIYVLAILLATGVMLLAFRYGIDSFLRLAFVAAGAWLSVYLFDVVVPATTSIGGVDAAAIALGGGLGAAVYFYPEWYVIDAAGAIMGAAGAGLFGIAFDVLPAIVMLSILAVYDAISVYRTEHMLSLASGVMDLRVPVLLVIPTSAGYSFLDAEFPDLEEDPTAANGRRNAEQGEGEAGSAGRDALFIGLGDAVIPSVLVASVAFFAPTGVPRLFGVPVPAVTAMVGTLAGLAVLLWLVLEDRAHAGLPLLNGGSIAGYLVGAVLSGLSIAGALGLSQYL
jgi:presenilin-like A22 family membrane protease